MNTLNAGYRMENGEIVIDAKEQRVLRIVEQEFKLGQGQTAIARTLNARGLTNRAGKQFTPQMVHHYLKRQKERTQDEKRNTNQRE